MPWECVGRCNQCIRRRVGRADKLLALALVELGSGIFTEAKASLCQDAKCQPFVGREGTWDAL